MSRFIAIENLSSYMCQLNSIVLSLLCDHTSMKCVDSSASFQFFSCPIRLIEELQINHPYHSLIIQTLQKFHNKYDGCSSKTFLFFLTTIYNHLQLLWDKKDRLFQKKIFNALEQLIDQSIFITKNKFTQNLSLNSDILHRICRHQSIYSDSLYQAYLYFTSSREQISHLELLTHFDNLHHITRVKYSEEKCLFIPGTILAVNSSIKGYRRTVLIDGYLLEDYTHLGYSNKLKLKHTSTKSSWIYLILSILKEYSIDVIICSGKIDEKLKDLNNENMFFIENIPTKTLRILGQNSLLNYLTDLNSEENILLFNFIQFNDDPLLTIVEKGSTIIQYVPFKSLIDIKHEQFVHCFARFRHILQKNLFLNGSGQFEDMLYQYWYKNREKSSIENDMAYECFLECLQKFVRELTNRKECFENNLIDDFDSKFDAWKTSIELLKILMQIDNVIQIVDDEHLSDI
jgi:hypothetical protein